MQPNSPVWASGCRRIRRTGGRAGEQCTGVGGRDDAGVRSRSLERVTPRRPTLADDPHQRRDNGWRSAAAPQPAGMTRSSSQAATPRNTDPEQRLDHHHPRAGLGQQLAAGGAEPSSGLPMPIARATARSRRPRSGRSGAMTASAATSAGATHAVTTSADSAPIAATGRHLAAAPAGCYADVNRICRLARHLHARRSRTSTPRARRTVARNRR